MKKEHKIVAIGVAGVVEGGAAADDQRGYRFGIEVASDG